MASPKYDFSMAVSWSLVFFHQVDILPGNSGCDRSFRWRLPWLDQLSADTETAGACLQEIGSRAQIDPAGGHDPNLRKRTRIALRTPAPLHPLGTLGRCRARFSTRIYLRGSESARHYRFVVAMAHRITSR